MCGIVGIAGQQEAGWLQAMNGAIVHRGPDDCGEYRDAGANVSLAMRRLSIQDLEGGHQPICNEDESIWIVFNGEIYNAPELRLRLEAAGHRFKTDHSDTEVLVHLYEELGQDMLAELNGMFAFVIHDRNRRVLFAARDRMGIKPFYYWQGGGRFCFASELKSLLTLPCIEREVNHEALSDYLTLLYVPDEGSIIQGVQRLPAGHCLTYDLDGKQAGITCYWQPKFDRIEHHSEGEWCEIMRAEMRQAVKRWTLSDVPVACSLSGGLDSSALVGLLGEMGYPRLKTFSLGFAGESEQDWDESALARLVADKWGTEHHEITMRPEDLLQDLVQMVWHLDEPYAGGLPSWHVFRAVGEQAKVCLTGTGGDELFGNYGKYRVFESEAMLRLGLAGRRFSPALMDGLAALLAPVSALSKRLPESWRVIGRERSLSRLADAFSRPFGKNYYANLLYMSDTDKHDVLASPVSDRSLQTSALLQRLFDQAGADDVRNGLAAVDFRTQLPEEFLMMSDRFSMAHGVEARVPFLDHQLVELAFRIPPGQRTRPDDPKYLLRQTVGDLLPPELLSAPKRGFVIPIELWLRRELRPLLDVMLHADRLRKQGIFRADFHARFVVPHVEGRESHTWQIWAVLMFQIWHFIFIEHKQKEKPTFSWQDMMT